MKVLQVPEVLFEAPSLPLSSSTAIPASPDAPEI